MSELKDRVSKEIIASMKAKEKVKLNVLRFIKKLLIENETSNKPIDENDIVIGHAKKLKDSISLFPVGSTQVDDIKNELVVLEDYLPKQMTKEEVQGLIAQIITTEGKDFGKVMKQLSSEIKGKFDSKEAVLMVKSSL
jgi:hypothetical protein